MQRPNTRFLGERKKDELRMQEDSLMKQRRVKPPSLADVTILKDKLKRLRSIGILARHRIKIGKSGVTNGIVESIHNEWRNFKIVRIKGEGAPTMNMKRTHQMEREREKILSTLVPLYDDWTGGKPVPVDVDQLIYEDFKFKKLYRLLLYGVKPALSNAEMTELRRLARPITPHFALGRNMGFDGLVAAVVKLWERSKIEKK
ncbi:hypothetical protein AXG93_1603s1100 [Marchantia polymorpha subsp. ruderalis]|uniref:CRM domain-containing protein n=1 Tax=Marchantia polymorpha subsp. ruderalis TaxID=1480154 RepID=A0A176VUX6_MARPO|nr:hypothetical protein AXG93_1603s1100 [Marchantia polymorpha subsp. ruderalis]